MSEQLTTYVGRPRRWSIDTLFCGWVTHAIRSAGVPISQSTLVDALRKTKSEVSELKVRDTLNVLVALSILKHEWNGETVLYSCLKELTDGESL